MRGLESELRKLQARKKEKRKFIILTTTKFRTGEVEHLLLFSFLRACNFLNSTSMARSFESSLLLMSERIPNRLSRYNYGNSIPVRVQDQS